MNSYLIQNSENGLEEKVAFTGMNFGDTTPIDVLNVFLAGTCVKDYKVLLVDEFQRINGEDETRIAQRLEKVQDTLEKLSGIYSVNPEQIVCSDFMGTRNYQDILKKHEQVVNANGFYQKLLKTVPEKFRGNPDALNYPLNEIACVDFLGQNMGTQVKVGPSTEKKYDKIMNEMGLPVDFVYLNNAYALGTKSPETVIHYISGHKGVNNGQRVYLDEEPSKALSKLSLGPDEASRYFLRLASAAGELLGKETFSPEEINNLYGKKLRKTTRNCVKKNILEPYHGVSL